MVVAESSNVLRKKLVSQSDWTWLPQVLWQHRERETDLELYERRRNAVLDGLRLIRKIGFYISGGLLVLLMLSDSMLFWAALGCVSLGMLLVALVLTLPAVAENFVGYYAYTRYGTSAWRSRFYSYRDFFSEIGHPIGENMRGAGLIWVAKYFFRIIPVQIIYALVLLLVLTFGIVEGSWSIASASIGVLVLGLSPVLIGEFSRGVQVGRAYFPGMLGLLTFTGYAAAQITREIPTIIPLFWPISIVTLVWCGVWSFRVLRQDILPARMSVTYLARVLQSLKVTKFSTYNSIYNDSFVRVLPPYILQECQIEWIDQLAQAKTNYIVVPGTSKKSVTVSDYPVGRQPDNGYDSDHVLRRIIEDHEIARYAIASFETFGTSRFWVHESEVTSYRDLILREISEQDRWRARAWVLDAAKLRAEILKTHRSNRANGA